MALPFGDPHCVHEHHALFEVTSLNYGGSNLASGNWELSDMCQLKMMYLIELGL